MRIFDWRPGREPSGGPAAPMRRIAIVGCGGSGKSHLARRLSERLGLPVAHLDDHYYDDDWNAAPAGEFAAMQRDLATADRWIIDGNYASTLPIRLARADTVIFLDLPATTCLWSIARRGGRHRINGSFLWYVLRYRHRMRPRVEALIAEHAGHARCLRLTSRRRVNRFLTEMGA
ncbi:topology modulation protein [Actinoplanes sp. NPDC049802]|uniref:topology modulation protein n=1 Tax=Actinoplanes sp. NPDC049802 TaxID=3154742 RepID=UPI0033CB4CC6